MVVRFFIIIKHILLYTARSDFFFLDPNTPQVPTPFPLDLPSQTDSTAISSTLTTQKSQPSRTNFEVESGLTSNPLTTSVLPSSGSQLTHLIIDTSGSIPRVPTEQIISPLSDPTSSQSLQREGSSIRYLFADHALNGTSIIHSTLSSSVNMYENPPPSYWRNENDVQSTGHRSSGTATPKPS